MEFCPDFITKIQFLRTKRRGCYCSEVLLNLVASGRPKEGDVHVGVVEHVAQGEFSRGTTALGRNSGKPICRGSLRVIPVSFAIHFIGGESSIRTRLLPRFVFSCQESASEGVVHASTDVV